MLPTVIAVPAVSAGFRDGAKRKTGRDLALGKLSRHFRKSQEGFARKTWLASDNFIGESTYYWRTNERTGAWSLERDDCCCCSCFLYPDDRTNWLFSGLVNGTASSRSAFFFFGLFVLTWLVQGDTWAHGHKLRLAGPHNIPIAVLVHTGPVTFAVLHWLTELRHTGLVFDKLFLFIQFISDASGLWFKCSNRLMFLG